MRIVHVVRQYAPSVGGLEAVVARLAGEQRRRLGHAVEVVTLDRLFAEPRVRLRGDEVVDGVPVRRLAWAGSSRYPLWPQVATRLAEADLVHVHAIDFAFDWLALTRPFHRRPMIASTHGGFFHTAFASRAKRVWFETITRASSTAYRRIVATSDNDGAVFRAIAGSRVTVIENGAEIDRFRDAASVDVVPVILYFGRWSSNKGLPELIDLVAALRAADPRWRLIVAGRPSELSADDLARRAAASGLGDAFELHASPSDEALRALMTRASYFGCLSHHEGFGIAAIEALSAGLVPILSDIPPFRKIVDGARCGLLVGGSRAVVETAAEVQRLHDATPSEPSAERARRIAFTRRYDWSSVVDRYEVAYRDALAAGAVGRRSTVP